MRHKRYSQYLHDLHRLNPMLKERSGPGQGDMTKPPYGAGFWKGNTTARVAQNFT